ncbi:piggyBac transposable element-derived protein 2-like [Ornithodoros turicata]|uniref:piggyBac transposable element-derived protein 2-like n=1 Tax=Ornithodoros turicata TaxID=34597 RepID=UPI0031391765
MPCPPDTSPKLRQHWQPMDYFSLYIAEDVYDKFEDSTNVAYHLRTGKLLSTSAAELKNFIDATFLMSCLGYPKMRLYWAQGTRVPVIADMMSRDRFFTLRSNLKVVNDLDVPDDVKKSDRLWKIKPVINSIREACRKPPRPSMVSIDDQIIPFTGITTLKQYVPGKPHITDLRNFVLASPSGLVLDYEIYLGKSTLCGGKNQELGIGANVILHLTATLPPGTAVLFDRYFTTIPLLDELAKKNLRATGTIMKNRLPKGTKMEDDKTLSKRGRGSSCQVVNSTSSTSLVKWMDNKPITLASTHIGEEPIGSCRRWSKKEKKYLDVPRPAIADEYNRYMGGVDLCDLMLSLYSTTQRTKKWTVRAMIFLLDLAAVNSWLQYKEDSVLLVRSKKNILGFLEFKMAFEHHLLAVDHGDTETCDAPPTKMLKMKVTPLPPVLQRHSYAKHMPELVSQSLSPRCRNPGCQKRSKVRCTTCDVFLCMTANRNCYKQFPTE